MRFAMLLSLLLLPLGLAFADDEKKEEKKTSDLINGTWKATSYEQEGNKGGVQDYVLIFKDGKYEQKNKGKVDETGAYKLNLDKKPHEIDIDILTGNDKGKKQPGIFKVEGDKLTWCLAMAGKDERPKKFETDADGGILVEFKREKEEKKEDK